MTDEMDQDRRTRSESSLPREARVREEDLEPFAALRYIARLFKALAVLVLVILLAEVILGLVQAGTAALPSLLVESTRLLVFAAFLWAGGDIALMLVETNHDLRATRILVARLIGEVETLRGRTEEGGPTRRSKG